MPNERLRSTIAAADVTPDLVARAVGVDPKTVERWITKNRLPHRTHRWRAAKLLGQDEAYLALHRRGCSRGLNPPVSSSDLAM